MADVNVNSLRLYWVDILAALRAERFRMGFRILWSSGQWKNREKVRITARDPSSTSFGICPGEAEIHRPRLWSMRPVQLYKFWG